MGADFVLSRNIYTQESGRWARRTADELRCISVAVVVTFHWSWIAAVSFTTYAFDTATVIRTLLFMLIKTLFSRRIQYRDSAIGLQLLSPD